MAYTIKKTCMACHSCYLECPAGAISLVHTKYEIDPEKCTGCGRCAQVCNISAAVDADAPGRETGRQGRREMCADIVVLGGGASGLIAAARAAELSGKKVVVLERAEKPGGNAWFAHDYSKYGTRWEREQDEPDTINETVRRTNRLMEWKINRHLINKATRATGRVFDWMEERAPEEFKEYYEMRPARELWFGLQERQRLAPTWKGRQQLNLNSRDAAIGPGEGGWHVIYRMLIECEKLGVEILTEHRAKEILTDEKGNFSGVLAESPESELLVNAEACVLATGGWAANDEMVKEKYPWYFGQEGDEPAHRFAVPTTTGDVCALGESCGAYVDYDNMWMNYFGPIHHPFNFSFFRTCTQPDLLLVNSEGRRFMDESDFTNGSWLISEQPKRYFHFIVDEPTLERLMKRQAEDPRSKPDKELFETYKTDLEYELKQGTAIKKADTVEELAEKCCIDPAALRHTVDTYNSYCREGFDPDFYKQPEALVPVENGPFYAIFTKTATDGAFGGVLIDENIRVLKKDKKTPIQGLFACGDNTGSWGFRRPGPGDHRTFILSELTWAVSSGFLAGESAAEYLNSKN